MGSDHAVESGDDLYVVSRVLGHAASATTSSFCGHVRPAQLRHSAELMDAAMRPAVGT
jgi:site-specific recombinase XerD